MPTAQELQTIIEQQAELIANLQDPSPKHAHRDPKSGVTWFCKSPYCEPPYDAVKGGGPQTAAARAETRGERIT